MSKFQSFATQGSFRDYQLQAPDETAKIEQETARTIRGRERAQAFLEQNNELYLRAQKLAQNQESAQREENFRLETENRKAFRDALDRDYQIQTENDRKKAVQIDQTYKQLSAFSKTAFELYGAVDQHITETQEKANAANTIIAGTTVQENIAIKGMVANLTRAEFEQQDLITNLVKEGKDVDALWTLYGRRNTRNFINNISTIQNTANGLDSYLNQVLLDLPEGLTAEQQKIEVEKAYRTFVADNFTVDGKQLNPKLINNVAAPILNSSYNRISSEIDREIKKERLQDLKDSKIKALNVLWDSGGGVQGFIEEHHTKNPSREKRELTYEWLVARLKSGTISPEDALAILNFEYAGPDGKATTWAKQFPTEIGIVHEAVRDLRRTAVADAALEDAERNRAAEDEIRQLADQFGIDGDGFYTDEEVAQLEAAEQKGAPGFKSQTLEAVRSMTVQAQEAKLIDEEFEKRANNFTLKRSDVLGIKGNYALMTKWLQVADQQEKLRNTPENKTNINAIKAKVAQDPRVKAMPGAENETVILMQERFVRQYNQLLKQTGDQSQALSLTLNSIQTLQSNPGAIVNGSYTEIAEQIKASAATAKTSLKQYQDFLKAASKPGFRDNPQKALNTIGVENYTKARQAVLQGREVPGIIKQGAELFNVTPLEFINFLSRGKAGEKPITLNAQLENLRSQIKPSTRRFYTQPTSERINRANLINNDAVSTGGVRATMGGNADIAKFRKAIIAKESGGSYTVVNPDSGAIGIGQVMPENVGPWTKRYLGKALTPEQFRYNPGAQDAVVNGRFRDMLADQRAAGYKGEQMIRRAAAVWYSGQASRWNDPKQETYNGRRYPSVADYTLSIWKAFQSSN